MTWREIDTAPKDGTHVLLYFPDGEGAHEGWWAWTRPDRWWVANTCYECEFGEPTRWMPLPEPPK